MFFPHGDQIIVQDMQLQVILNAMLLYLLSYFFCIPFLFGSFCLAIRLKKWVVLFTALGILDLVEKEGNCVWWIYYIITIYGCLLDFTGYD